MLGVNASQSALTHAPAATLIGPLSIACGRVIVSRRTRDLTGGPRQGSERGEASKG